MNPAPSASPAGPDPRARALVALVVVQALFGAMPVFGKIAIAGLGPGAVALLRMAGGTLVFGTVAVVTQQPLVPRSLQPRLLLCGICGISANQLLFLNGLSRTSATHAALLTTTIPIQTLLAAGILGRERLTRRRVLGVVLAAAGVLTLLSARSATGTETLAGDLMVLGNAGVYACYLVLSRDLMDRWPPLSVLPWLFGWGLVTAIPFVSLPDPSGASAAAWASAIFVVLGPTVGSYWLNLFALRTLPASVVALFIYLQPFLAAGLAYGVLGERPTGRIGLAAALAFAGVWLASRAPRDDKSRRTDPGATG